MRRDWIPSAAAVALAIAILWPAGRRWVGDSLAARIGLVAAGAVVAVVLLGVVLAAIERLGDRIEDRFGR